MYKTNTIETEPRKHPLFRRNNKIISTYALAGLLVISVSDWLTEHGVETDYSFHSQTLYIGIFLFATAFVFHRLLCWYTHAVINAERERQEAFETTVNSWAELLAVRHKETQEHSLRVARMTENFAMLWGKCGSELDNYRRGALLHDIGKLHIPDEILNKPGPLNDEEWRIIKQHPDAAKRMLENIPYVKDACFEIPVYHHERWDGSGYPWGLKGQDIPFSARLFSIIDVWESMTHSRAYKPALDEATVLQHIAGNAGTHFDPDLAPFFVEHYEQIKNFGTAGNG